MKDRRRDSSVWSKQLSRRGALQIAGLGLGAAVIGGPMLGCGGGSDEKAKIAAEFTALPEKAKRGGVLSLPDYSQYRDLDPMIGGDRVQTGTYVHDRLVAYDAIHNKNLLLLGESAETTPDHLTYIWKLKPNAKFQNLPPTNGRPVDSDDVRLAWKVYLDNPRVTAKAFFNEFVDKVEAPDRSTVVVKMKKPYAWAMTTSGFSMPVVVPKELTEPGKLEQTAVGCGPYVLDSFDPASGVSYKRRPDGYYDADRAFIDKVNMTVILDEPAREAAFKAKVVDTKSARDKKQAQSLQEISPYVRIDKDISGAAVLCMRGDKDGLFYDERIRQGVYALLDIDELIERLELGEGEWSGPVPPYLPEFALTKEDLKPYFPHDVAKAKQLLTAGGWNFDLEVDLKFPASESASLYCQILQKQFGAAGIKTKLVPLDVSTTWIAATNKRDWQLMAAGQATVGVPDGLLKGFTTMAGGTGNWGYWSDREIDDLYERQAVEFDPAKQKQIIMEAQRLVLKKYCPCMGLYAKYAFAARWAYYYSPKAWNSPYRLAHYNWLDTDHPEYPKDRK